MAVIKKFRIKNFKKKLEILKLEKISVFFNKRKILENLNINLQQGEILGLLGPNGVGKSTIFNLIIGLIKPDFGSIIINSEKVNKFPIYIRAKKFKIGFVPQNGGYFHNLTVYENLKAISEIIFNNKNYQEEKINSLLSKFELDNVRNIKAYLLSGGQKKKLVISIALISDPKILLLDEPFAALDVLTIKMLKELIVNLQSQEKISICICDHQARDLLSCVDSAIILSNCKIIAKGTPAELVSDIKAKNAYFGDSFKFN